jgi:hypothetical protein
MLSIPPLTNWYSDLASSNVATAVERLRNARTTDLGVRLGAFV